MSALFRTRRVCFRATVRSYAALYAALYAHALFRSAFSVNPCPKRREHGGSGELVGSAVRS